MLFKTAVNIPWCIVICHVLVIATSFNIDVKYPIYFESKAKDYFGYSVGLLRNREGQHALITAPRANSSILGDQLYQPGVLFKCKISFTSRTQSCTEVLLDAYGNTVTYKDSDKDLSYMDKKDDMFLGVSLDVQQNSGNNKVVTCGHLWKNQYYGKHYLANGVCYVIDNELDPTTVKKLVPLVNKSKQSLIPPGIYYYAFAQAGTSAAFSEDGKYLFLGAPGFYDWTGTVLSYSNPPGNRNYENPVIPDSVADLNPESYIGYSVTSGKFFSTPETFIAMGAPRDKHNYGQVYIVKAMNTQSDKFLIHMKKEGKQFGEYFGASVLGVDMNKDSFADLLIGAPFHSSDSGGDEGKVYVYISNGVGLQEYAELSGEHKPNGRFGSCIVSVGDLNQDGWNDVAIGAPYEDGQGAVYIYHGTSTGMNPQYVQRIQASQLSTSLSGFGISVSHGLDIDGNYYPDILIGSYQSSQAVLLRTHPVIKLTGKVDFSAQQINTNVTSCEFEGEKVSCINVTTCLHYIGKHSTLSLNFETQLYIDFSRQNNRARSYLMFEGNPTSVIRRNITINIGTDTCFTDEAFIRADAKDLITPVDFMYIYRLAKDTEDAFCKKCPVIDQTVYGNNITKALSFQTGCGKDNQCLSDLVVNAYIVGNPMNSPLIIGKTTTLTINIDVTNTGEPAYISELLIYLPPETPNVNQDFCALISYQQQQETNATLLCDLGNPLPQDKTMNVQIKIDVSKIPSSTESLTVLLQTKTGSTEVSPADNDMELKISFKSLADIAITGTFEHELIQYDDVKKKPLSVSHTYFVMNHGPSPIDMIDIELSVPTKYGNPDSLVEFASFNLQVDSGEPQTIPATCDHSAIELKPIHAVDTKISQDGVFDEGDLIARERNNRTSRASPAEEQTIFDTDSIKMTTRSKKSVNDHSVKKRKNYVMNCKTANCMVIRCMASPFLNSKKFARLVITIQVNVSALDDTLDPWYRIEYFTEAKISIRNEKGDVQPQPNNPDETSVKTILVHPGPVQSEEVELWIIYLSVGIGVLLLIIILIVLLKVGFFTRQQKEKMREMMTHADLKEWDPYLINGESDANDGGAPSNT